MTRLSNHRQVDRFFQLEEASGTLAVIRAARAPLGVHRQCARYTGTVSRALRHTA